MYPEINFGVPYQSLQWHTDQLTTQFTALSERAGDGGAAPVARVHSHLMRRLAFLSNLLNLYMIT